MIFCHKIDDQNDSPKMVDELTARKPRTRGAHLHRTHLHQLLVASIDFFVVVQGSYCSLIVEMCISVETQRCTKDTPAMRVITSQCVSFWYGDATSTVIVPGSVGANS